MKGHEVLGKPVLYTNHQMAKNPVFNIQKRETYANLQKSDIDPKYRTGN